MYAMRALKKVSISKNFGSDPANVARLYTSNTTATISTESLNDFNRSAVRNPVIVCGYLHANAAIIIIVMRLIFTVKYYPSIINNEGNTRR
jgi:hypothetical protein